MNGMRYTTAFAASSIAATLVSVVLFVDVAYAPIVMLVVAPLVFGLICLVGWAEEKHRGS